MKRLDGVGLIRCMKLLMLVSVLASATSSVAYAQDPYQRLVRKFEMPELGLANPAGLAYSPGANAFLVAPSPGSNTLRLVTFAADLTDEITLATTPGDPANMAFDGLFNSLLFWDAGANELVEIEADENGLPRPIPEAITRFDAGSFGVDQVRGITVDPATGELFILSVPERSAMPGIVRVIPDAQGRFIDPVVSTVTLRSLRNEELRGIAFNPSDRHLYVVAPAAQELLEMTLDGEILSTRDLSAFELRDVRNMVFAPSGDQTDDPTIMSLYMAESEQDSGDITELSLTEPKVLNLSAITVQALLAQQASQASQTQQVSLVNIIFTSLWSPPSPDPSDAVYLPSTNSLLISDSEVNEMSIFAGVNLFHVTLSGDQIEEFSTTGFSDEPSGIAYNPDNQHLFFSDDTGARRVYELDPGPDGNYNTPDDIVTSFRTGNFSSSDPEGVAYDTIQGHLFIVDGLNAEVFEVDPGANGIFDGVSPSGDDIVSQFDTAILGLFDPEGVEFNPDTGTLYIISRGEEFIVETTRDGTAVSVIDFSLALPKSPAGLAYAPSSISPSEKSLYIVDRGVDNDSDPNENDGRIYEISLGSSSANFVTTSFQDGLNGYGGTRDTWLDAGDPDRNRGSENKLELKNSRSSLLYWDLSIIPSGSAIQSVDITVNITKDSQDSYELYESLRPWVEGHATWDEYALGQSWEVPGADGPSDRGSTVLGAFTGTNGPATFSLNAAGVAVVQSWIDDPASNHGFVILDYVDADDDFALSSRNDGTVSKRPMLTVTYDPDGLPGLSIGDVAVTEGNSGTLNAEFTVMLAYASTETVTVDYATTEGTAMSGVDYVPVSGQLSFQPGETSQSMMVTVYGDADMELNENFFVELSNAINASIGNYKGTGTIIDDDSPLIGEPITFSVSGDYPYDPDEQADLQEDMDLHDLYSPSEFYVHVGDIMGSSEGCFQQRYVDVANALKTLSVPAFIILGDNEWTDCADPAQGRQWWDENFSNFEQNYCRPPAVARQTVRQENWVFVSKGVLFIGINIPDGDVGLSELNQRLQDNADWVNFHFQDKVDQVRAAVVFGHAGPSVERALFFSQFEEASLAFSKPVFYVMGDDHVWTLDNPWSAPNMQRLTVNRGGDEDPPQITVTMDPTNPFEIVREPWLDNPPVLNNQPCVDAGLDQMIAQFQTLDLNGMATDDGVPTSPGTLTINWNKLSGPGDAVFGDASAPNTTVNFTSAGLYDLRLTATDGIFTATDELTINVEDTGPLETVSFQDGVNGYSGTRDTWLDAGDPDRNRGGENKLELKDSRSALLYWDLSSIPWGSTIQSVDITINATKDTQDSYELYESLRPWVEDQATWDEYASGLSWQVGGADGSLDRGSAVLGAFTGVSGPATISLNAAGVAAVQSWVDNPSSNHGFVILDYVNGSDDYAISSHNDGTVEKRPMLTVRYSSGDGTPNLAVTDANADEAAGTLDFTVSLSAASEQVVTVDYATADSTAHAGSDYTAASGTLTIPANTTSSTIAVPITDDALSEPSEVFKLLLSNAVGATLYDSLGLGTITDNEIMPALTIADTSADEAAGTMVFTVTMSFASGQAVTVDYATSDSTALAGSDYTAVSGTLVIPVDSTTGVVAVPIADDALGEPTEFFKLVLSNPAGATTDDNLGVGTITNADGPITVSFQDGVNGYSGTRDTWLDAGDSDRNRGNENKLELKDTRSALLYWDLTNIPSESTIRSVDITVNATKDTQDSYELYESLRPWVEDEATWDEYASGQSWQVGGADGSLDRGSTVLGAFTGVSGPATISLNAAGVAAVQSWVDNPSSNHGFVLLDYINGSDDFAISSRNEGTISKRPILTVSYSSEDGPPQLAVADANAGEAAGTLDFTVSLSAASEQDVTVDYTTADSTAHAGSDYTAATGKLTIPANTTSATIAVPITDDALSEPSEFFKLLLTNPVNAVLATDQGVGTITDDDGSGSIVASFQDGVSGYAGTRDAVLKADAPTTNYGSHPEGELDGTPDESTLLFWDVTGIPIGSTVESVDITVNVTNTSGATYEIYDLKRAWVENEVTWNEYASGQSWEGAGALGSGDRGSTAFGALTAPNTGLTTISLNAEGVAAVQVWVDDPSSNHGLIVQDYINHSNGLDFSSRETATIANRPMLAVTYSGHAGGNLASKSSAARPELMLEKLPEKIALDPNYPNPFSQETTIEYALPERAAVRLMIYNIRGQLVCTLVGGSQEAGYKRVHWDGRDDAGRAVGSGVYILQLTVDQQRFIGKMVLVK